MARWIFIALLCICSIFTHAQQDKIQHGKIYVKLTAEAYQNQRASEVFASEEIISASPLRKNQNNRSEPSILDGMYAVFLQKGTDEYAVCSQLEKSQSVVYAEPVYLETQLYVPNDPSAGNGDQDYLEVIHAPEAWDVTRGDSNIVIGIIDSGLDFTHEDIVGKIYLNEADPPNGLDDDNNGYIDDYKGYDFADEDSIPQNGISHHGNRVGGVAGADTDNGIGIAGIGFNTKIGALKNFKSDNNQSNNSYEAILYAADNGYDIINLSWGSIGTFSQAHQDIITYAAVEKDVVIIAAGGNTPEDIKFYPASYDHVLSVSSTNIDDEKSGFATYNYSVDLMAPGSNIYSTFKDNGYATDNGTSYSAPMVAGAAALVKTIHPDLSALQIMEVLRVTTDDIYQIGSNSNFEGKLGSGRLNIFRALTEDALKSIRVTDYSLENSYGTSPFPGDTLYMGLELKSYLDPIENGMIDFSSHSEHLTILTSSVQLDQINTMEQLQLQGIPIAILSADTPPESELDIRLDFRDSLYSDFQYISTTSSPDYIHITTESVGLTVAGNAGLGYQNDVFSGGMGLEYEASLLAYRLGFLIHYEDGSISDHLTTAYNNTIKESDFINVTGIRIEKDRLFDIATSTMFSDSAFSDSLLVENSVFADSTQQYMILEYFYGNPSADTISMVDAGIYIDWELANKFENKSWYEADQQALVSTNGDSSIWSALGSLTDLSPHYLALDLEDNEGNLSDLETDSFADEDLTGLLQNPSIDSAGRLGTGNNIANFILQDSLAINPFSSEKTTFLVAIADTYSELIDQIEAARSKYQVRLEQPTIIQSIVSCEGASLKIHPGKTYDYTYYADAFGLDTIATSDTLTTGIITSDTTFYVTENHKGYKSKVAAISVTLIDQVAGFSLSTDTLYLDEDVNQVHLLDQSFQAISWSWNFGNGLQSTLQNPSVSYQNPGNYMITLFVENDLGCSGMISKNLVVAERPPLPDIVDQTICEGEDVLLTATNTQNLAFYRNEEDETPLLKASELTIPEVTSDTMIFVTNLENGFESRKLLVKIEIQKIVADFIVEPDTTTEQTTALLTSMTEMADSLSWFVDDQFLGSEPNLIFEVTKTDYIISLAAYSALGCIDSLGRNYSFRQSPKPTINLAPVCVGDIVTLKPENGQIFGFYKDETLQQLFKKGQSLTLDPVQQDTSIYVVGLDSLLPSEPLRVDIIPIEFTFEITASTDTLFLNESLTASFSINTNNISEVTWHINDQFVESQQRPTLLFDSAGSYQVKCLATNLEGCSGIDTFSLVVLDKRPDKPLSTPASNDWLVYPNPNEGIFYVRSNSKSAYTITDLSGQIVQKGMLDRGVNQISCRSLQGVYFMYVDEQRMAKIIIK